MIRSLVQSKVTMAIATREMECAREIVTRVCVLDR